MSKWVFDNINLIFLEVFDKISLKKEQIIMKYLGQGKNTTGNYNFECASQKEQVAKRGYNHSPKNNSRLLGEWNQIVIA